jgi:hypothetical protein
MRIVSARIASFSFCFRGVSSMRRVQLFQQAAACVAFLVFMAGQAQAGVVLQLDLSTVNQVTISATTGLSLATVSGSDGIGVHLKDFFGNRVFSTSGSTRLAGANLVYFNATSDGSPSLSRGNSTDPGLNIFSMDDGTPDPASFTSGVQAFKGSATWSITAQQYAVFLQAPTSGDVYAFADTIDDLNGGPQVIGQYSSAAVPEPTSMAIFGLGALGMAYRACRKSKCKA